MKLFLNSIAAFLVLLHSNIMEKVYVKKYHKNGVLQAEGWMQNNKKIAYWYTYNSKGILESEGHFKGNQKNGYWYYYNVENCKSIEGRYKNGKKVGWWIFTQSDGDQIKVQFSQGKKNGLILYFKKGKVIPYKAERFENNRKLGSWSNYSDFKRDNPNY